MQMELRYNEVERARGIYERYVRCLPEVKSWVRYAKFEMKSGDVPRARAVYERAVQELEGEADMVHDHPLFYSVHPPLHPRVVAGVPCTHMPRETALDPWHTEAGVL